MEGNALPERDAQALHADLPSIAKKRDLNEHLSRVDRNVVVGHELGHVKVIAILTYRPHSWP